jgi:hypothetical protein
MTVHPKVPKDLALAPVAAAIDLNLQRLRDQPPNVIERALQSELDRADHNTAEKRTASVRDVALRGVDAHDWEADITEDACRLRLSGGSVTLDLGLGEAVMHYIRDGVE